MRLQVVRERRASNQSENEREKAELEEAWNRCGGNECRCGKAPCPVGGLLRCVTCGDIKKKVCRKAACKPTTTGGLPVLAPPVATPLLNAQVGAQAPVEATGDATGEANGQANGQATAEPDLTLDLAHVVPAELTLRQKEIQGRTSGQPSMYQAERPWALHTPSPGHHGGEGAASSILPRSSRRYIKLTCVLHLAA